MDLTLPPLTVIYLVEPPDSSRRLSGWLERLTKEANPQPLFQVAQSCPPIAVAFGVAAYRILMISGVMEQASST